MYSFIYIITDGEYFKVGVTKQEPEKRLKQLQTGHPRPLKILSIFKVPAKLTYTLEKRAHNLIQSYYPKRGEWFKSTSAWHINLLVDSVCQDFIVDNEIMHK